MDFARLRALAAVAREGSVTAAAESLNYSQPTISHHLARLEHEVGVTLTTRVGRGLELTQAGRLLAARAEEILGQLESARSEVAAYAGLTAGRLRLAAFPSALATIVPLATARFATLYPAIDVALTEAEPPDAITTLRSGEVDVAVVFRHGEAETPAYRDVTASPVLSEPLYVVTATARRWSGERTNLATYQGERWIGGCDRCRTHLLASCERAGFRPTIGFETDDFVATQALVAAGLGVSTLPGLALRASRNPGVRIDRLPGDARVVEVATYGGSTLPVATAAFLDVLKELTAHPITWPRSG